MLFFHITIEMIAQMEGIILLVPANFINPADQKFVFRIKKNERKMFINYSKRQLCLILQYILSFVSKKVGVHFYEGKYEGL